MKTGEFAAFSSFLCIETGSCTSVSHAPNVMPRERERTIFFAETVLESSSGRHPARVSDISGGGCYIDSIVEVNVGDEIAFEINSFENRAIRFTGTVVYHFAGMGFGVQYSNLTQEQLQFLKQFT